MANIGAFTVTKENVEDDRALLQTGVIGTGTEVVIRANLKANLTKKMKRWKNNQFLTTTFRLILWIAIPSRSGIPMTGQGIMKTSSSRVKGIGILQQIQGRRQSNWWIQLRLVQMLHKMKYVSDINRTICFLFYNTLGHWATWRETSKYQFMEVRTWEDYSRHDCRNRASCCWEAKTGVCHSGWNAWKWNLNQNYICRQLKGPCILQGIVLPTGRGA